MKNTDTEPQDPCREALRDWYRYNTDGEYAEECDERAMNAIGNVDAIDVILKRAEAALATPNPLPELLALARYVDQNPRGSWIVAEELARAALANVKEESTR